MSSNADACRIDVEDNGCSTMIESTARPDSFGLLGLREQVRQLRGTTTIDSAQHQLQDRRADTALRAIRPDAVFPG
jgi:signal transduction histidine kinase